MTEQQKAACRAAYLAGRDHVRRRQEREGRTNPLLIQPGAHMRIVPLGLAVDAADMTAEAVAI